MVDNETGVSVALQVLTQWCTALRCNPQLARADIVPAMFGPWSSPISQSSGAESPVLKVAAVGGASGVRRGGGAG